MNFLSKIIISIFKPRSKVFNDTGKWGEAQALEFLKGEGYSILGVRVRPNKHDEIDIVVCNKKVLAFVEVKTRKNEDFGRPASAVNAKKRQILCRAAAAYLRRQGYPKLVYRFDIVEVVGSEGDAEKPVIRHLEDAFRFPTKYRFPVRN